MADEQPTPQNEASWYRLSTEEVLERLDANQDGLNAQQTQERLEQYGSNSIRTEQQVSAWKVLLDQFTSPMIYILIIALVVTLLLQSWGDAIVIALVLVINATIGFIQEYRAQSAVQSLMEMVSPKAKVRRDGQEQKIDGDDLVPGDVVLLEQGEMVPADLRLLKVRGLQFNESALTGESVPVSKTDEGMADAAENLPPADQKNMAFMGTAVTSGRGEGIVVSTGTDTQLGEIAEQVRGAGETQTPLQRRMDRLAKWIAVVIVFVAALAFGVGLWLGRSVPQMFLLAVSLAVAAIPAGLPVVMTVALAVGVRRMARRHAVIRHLPAVETLGSCTVIVSDKTGTLTQNRMTVEQIYAGEREYELTGGAGTLEGEIRPSRNGDEQAEADQQQVDLAPGTPLYLTLLCGALNNSAKLHSGGSDKHAKPTDEASSETPAEEPPDDARQQGAEEKGEESSKEEDSKEQSSESNRSGEGDPMEVALLMAAAKTDMSREDLRKRYAQIDEVPFRTEQRFSATVHEAPDEDGSGPVVLVKGAPERIIEMSSSAMATDGETRELDRQRLEAQNQHMASRGLRVLAMAVGRGDEAAKSIQGDSPRDMTFVGMVGLRDPARPEAVQAVDDCHRAGIRVIMVTGDHANTAAAIAQQVHLDRSPQTASVTDGDGRAQEASGDSNGQVKSSAESSHGELPETHTGQEIAGFSDSELDAVLERTNVFARVKPDHKVRIVNRLKARQQIVAVTGDGVNDAPALKTAHLGSAMGETGTDVAKEASDMVITDDNFASVYSAVEEGRTAFRNIRMATFFLLSTGAADVLIILLSLGLRWPLPLLPAQILWCNVVTNGIADVALGFEKGEKSLFRRPPRPIDEGVLDGALLERLAFVAVWLTVGTLGVFYWVMKQDGGVDLARVSALTTLVLFQMVHVFNCRSEDVSIFKKNPFSNKVLFGGVLVSLLIHIGALYLPWTQRLLHFQPLPWQVWVASISVAATAIIVNELHKRFRPRETVNRQTKWIGRWVRSRRNRNKQLSESVRQRLDRIEETTQQNRESLKHLRQRSEERQPDSPPDDSAPSGAAKSGDSSEQKS